MPRGIPVTVVSVRIEDGMVAWINTQAELRGQNRSVWLNALLERERKRVDKAVERNRR